MRVLPAKTMVNAIVSGVATTAHALWDSTATSVRKVRNSINVDNKLMDI